MDETKNSELGRRLAALRVERGWSQGWLASQAGMTQSVLSRVEAGKREARASELAELARALGVGPESLLAGLGEATDAALAPREADAFEAGSIPPGAGGPRESGPSLKSSRLARESAPFTPTDGRLAFSVLGRRDVRPESVARRECASLDARLDVSDVGQAAEALPADLSSLPPIVAGVVEDYLRLRELAARETYVRDLLGANPSWDSIDAHGRRRPAGKPSGLAAGRHTGVVSWNEPRDRYARLWRHELGIGVDGPVPDLVALFEDTGLAEVVVARLTTAEPVCANVTLPGVTESGPTAARRRTTRRPDADDVNFIFVNADRPVTLQRHALVHAFAHLTLGHGDVVDRRIEWSRATPPETEANDFAEEFLAPADAVARWYDRHDDPPPSVDVLLELAGAFGITFWAALYRSRAAGRLGLKPFARLQHELRARQWALLPEQSFRGGLRDTLSTLSEEAPLPPPGAVGVGGVPAPRTRDRAAAPDAAARGADASEAGSGAPAVLRAPARLRVWTLQSLRGGRLSLEQAAAVLRRPAGDLAAELERLGLE